MRTLLPSLMLLPLLACGGAQEPAAAVTTPAAAPSPVDAAPPPPPAPPPGPSAPVALPLPAALAPMQRVACAWDFPAWQGNTLRLRLSDKGEPFATVQRTGSVKFALPAGAASAAHVELQDGGVRLSARVAASDMSLYPRAAESLKLATGEQFVTGGHSALTWENGAPDELLSSLTFAVEPPGAKGTIKSQLKHACAAYSLLPADFDPTGALGQSPKGRVQLRSNKDVGFELGRVGLNTRVAVPRNGGWLVRNEPSTSFVKVVGNVDLHDWYKGDALPAPAPRDTRVPGWLESSCSVELQLITRIDSESAVVGVITTGTKFQVGPEAQGFTRVGLPSTDLLLTEKGQFLVRSSDLQACKK